VTYDLGVVSGSSHQLFGGQDLLGLLWPRTNHQTDDGGMLALVRVAPIWFGVVVEVDSDLYVAD